MKNLSLALAAALALGCSSSSETAPASAFTPPASAPSDAGPSGDDVSGHDVEYVAVGGGLTVGRSALQLRLTRRDDGQPATGLASAIAIAPVMRMASMSHGAPVPKDAVRESGTPGTYDVTLFFSMASVDPSGNPAGQWTLNVVVGEEPPVAIDVTVSAATGADTTHRALQSATDQIAGAGGMKSPRKYLLFRDSLAPRDGGHELVLFLATVAEGMMVFPPVTTGLELKDAAGNPQRKIDTLELSASADATTWTPMTCDDSARCRATLTGLTAGTAGSAFVTMKINGEDYTTDGAAPDGRSDLTTNAFATFTLTP